MTFEALWKILDIGPLKIFGLWLITACLLFLPEHIANAFGISALRNQYRGWIGMVSLSLLCWWIVQMVPHANARYVDKKAKSALPAKITSTLVTLNAMERLVLYHCLNTNVQTIYLPFGFPYAASLSSKGLLNAAPPPGRSPSWPYTIPDDVWGFIRTHPELVVSPEDLQKHEFQYAYSRFEQDVRSYLV